MSLLKEVAVSQPSNLPMEEPPLSGGKVVVAEPSFWYIESTDSVQATSSLGNSCGPPLLELLAFQCGFLPRHTVWISKLRCGNAAASCQLLFWMNRESGTDPSFVVHSDSLAVGSRGL